MSNVSVQYAHGDVEVIASENIVLLNVITSGAPVVQVIGEQGPAYGGSAGGGDLLSREYTHTQAVPAVQWDIPHDLGFRPVVYVTDTTGDECEGNVDHVSDDLLIITFSAAFAGIARLS